MNTLNSLPVHPAYNRLRYDDLSQFYFAVGLILVNLVLFFPFYQNYQQGIAHIGDGTFIVLFGLSLISLLIFVAFLLDKRRIDREDKEFLELGVTTTAKIVYKEQSWGGDSPDDYYIYYQFDDKFVVEVKLLDEQRSYFFHLPEGSMIEIEYLKNNPFKSRLKTKK